MITFIISLSVFWRDENIRMKENAMIKKLEHDWIESIRRYEDLQKVFFEN